MPKRAYRISRTRAAAEVGIRIADILLAPLVLMIVPLLWLLARMGWRARLTQAIFDRAGVGLLRHHYYTPLVLPGDLVADLSAVRNLPGIDLREAEQQALLKHLSYAAEAEQALAEFDFDNPNFARMDAFVLYGMLRHFQPRRMIEIGSGFSTLVAREALSRNETACRHICIEPFEMPWLESSGIEVRREPVETIGLDYFAQLEAGDVLFIDSTHIIRPQGDVVREFLQILPSLNPGVIVHVHDVYTPHDIHPYLVVEQRKLWNEQYLMEALLSGGGALFQVMLANYWICRRHPDLFATVVPGFSLPPERDGCSFWFRTAP